MCASLVVVQAWRLKTEFERKTRKENIYAALNRRFTLWSSLNCMKEVKSEFVSQQDAIEDGRKVN